MNAQNVVVIVSRWYGGIHLGSERFKHINNAAQQVLESNNLTKTK
jgi:putative IMPACT (imprinted ancient) family translation regulator